MKFVAAGAADQVGGRAVLDDAPGVDHHDPVGNFDRGEAMGDDEGRALGEQRLQRALDETLRRNVER